MAKTPLGLSPDYNSIVSPSMPKEPFPRECHTPLWAGSPAFEIHSTAPGWDDPARKPGICHKNRRHSLHDVCLHQMQPLVKSSNHLLLQFPARFHVLVPEFQNIQVPPAKSTSTRLHHTLYQDIAMFSVESK